MKTRTMVGGTVEGPRKLQRAVLLLDKVVPLPFAFSSRCEGTLALLENSSCVLL